MLGVGGLSDAADAECDYEYPREEEGGEGHVPDPVHGVLHGGGIERPEPAGPEGYVSLCGVAAARDLVDHGGCCGREDAIDGEDDPRGGRCVDAEDFEDSRQQQREERRRPRGGAGVAGEGIGVAVAGGYSARDAADLPAELEVVLKEADAVGVGEGDVEQADDEGYPEEARLYATVYNIVGDVAGGLVATLHPRAQATHHLVYLIVSGRVVLGAR